PTLPDPRVSHLQHQHIDLALSPSTSGTATPEIGASTPSIRSSIRSFLRYSNAAKPEPHRRACPQRPPGRRNRCGGDIATGIGERRASPSAPLRHLCRPRRGPRATSFVVPGGCPVLETTGSDPCPPGPEAPPSRYARVL